MKKNILDIISKVDMLYENPKCELEFHSNYELLVAVMLSAQCTDKRVNAVTNELFKEFNTPEKMITLSQAELEKKIRACGFFRNKAKHILEASRDIVEKYNEYKRLEHDIEDLEVLKHDSDPEMAEMAKMEQENLLNERDNETKIIVAQINAQARQLDDADVVENTEGISEESRAKLNEQIREFDARLSLDKERLAFDKDKAKTDARLKEKQINSRPKTTKK
mgnify:CR=1 FL=1